jgi:glycosyltransferase involved in cell wall biosynthesis
MTSPEAKWIAAIARGRRPRSPVADRLAFGALERAPKPVQESTFMILANGASGSPPASGLMEYLIAHGARRVTTVFHPLTTEGGNRHELATYEPGREPRRHTVRFPAHPPYTYPLDLLVPPLARRVDGWFAFNNLLCARGLLERRAGRAGTVAYWAVDFVPDRFGEGTLPTQAYDALDAYCCRHADLRIELSKAALMGRDSRHGIAPDAGATRAIAPIGAWLERVPVTPSDGWKSRRVIFVGHLVERMGGDTVIGALALLKERGFEVTADIAGRGPLEEQLQADVQRSGLRDTVNFHGFIFDHPTLERLLSRAAVALAPYNTRVESFTRYADPSKLKSYLAAGLPTLLTEVPPNAQELARQAGAEIVPDNAADFADAIERLLTDADTWQRRRTAALEYARRFDWNAIVAEVLATAGFESPKLVSHT